MPPTDMDLVMWTIYDCPKDYPGEHVARKFLVRADKALATDVVVREPLRTLRERFASQGLVCITRSPGDDAVIVETWL